MENVHNRNKKIQLPKENKSAKQKHIRSIQGSTMGDKSHQCIICEKHFASQQTLKQHKKNVCNLKKIIKINFGMDDEEMKKMHEK